MFHVCVYIQVNGFIFVVVCFFYLPFWGFMTILEKNINESKTRFIVVYQYKLTDCVFFSQLNVSDKI